MSDPTIAANDHEQHTTTIEITGNGQVNAAFENTEGPEGAPTPQTPPPQHHIQRPSSPPPQTPRPSTPPPQIPTPQHDTTHMNGETPHMNGEAKTNGVELRTPGSEDNKEVNEAVNLELVSMQPYSNSIPIKKESTELDIGDPYDEYFVPVNQHKKYMRGEKLYVTQDKRRSLGGSKKKCCWGVLTVIVLGGIVAILLGVILSSDNAPIEESRNFNGNKADIGGGFLPTPSPHSTPQPPRPTTDMSEMYLKNVLQGELTIGNLEFTPGLADHNSSEFRNLAASLEEELKSALFDHQTLHYGSADITVKVLEFRSGSVIVVYRVGWEFKDGIKNPPDPIDKEGLKTRLQDHLRSHDGFLYNYRLTLHNLKSERVTDACKMDNGQCSQNCIFDRSNLKITCTCEEMYILSSDGKTCIRLDDDKLETPSSSEADHVEHETFSSPEPDHVEQETSSEVHQHTSSEHLDEHLPETEVPAEPQTPKVTESSTEPQSPTENEHSDIKNIYDESGYTLPHPSQEPMSEYNTSEMYESSDYQSMEDHSPKSSSDPTMPHEPITETGSSLENPSHNQSSMEQSTEGNANVRQTDMAMDLITLPEPSMTSDSSKNLNESELALDPISSSTSMNWMKDIADVNPNLNYVTTHKPAMTLYPEEKNHWSSDSSEVPETYEYPDEYSSSESSSAPSSTSERLAKYNQFPSATPELEDSLYTHRTDYGPSAETTTPETSADQQMTMMPTLPEYKTEQPSEEPQHSFQPTVGSTDIQEEITTKKIYSESDAIKSYDSSDNSQTNVMTTPSSTIEMDTKPDNKEESISSEMLPTTVKSFDIWEKVEGHSVNISEESSTSNNNSESKEKEGMIDLMTVTTMMPLTENEGVKNDEMFTTHDLWNLQSSSSPEPVISETDYPPIMMTQDHVMSSLNKTEVDSSQTVSNIEVTATPIEDAHFNFSQSSKQTTFITTTPIAPSSTESADSISAHSQPSLSDVEPKENMNDTTTEIPGMNESHIISEAPSNGSNSTINESTIETDHVPTTEQMLHNKENMEEHEGHKMDMIDNSDSMVPRFLVEGENMPSIALTPNPDLSGPYSVDSTIQPVTEEDESEEIKSTRTVSSDESSSLGNDHSSHWSDSKNALNSLDDDYNEEEQYGNYKSIKGKPEHVTKGYKNIKIDQPSRVPQDNDAMEQTHNHQTEHVPIALINETNNSTISDVPESHTHYPSTDTDSPTIKEEEKLLIEEVYTPVPIDNIKPNNSKGSTDPLTKIPDFTTTKSIESPQTNQPSSSESTDTEKEKLELKEIDDISEENVSSSESDEKSNLNPMVNNLTLTNIDSTTTTNLELNADLNSSSINSSHSNTTSSYSLNPNENQNNYTNPLLDVNHSSDMGSVGLNNSDSNENERGILNSPSDTTSVTDIVPTTSRSPDLNSGENSDVAAPSANMNITEMGLTTTSSIMTSNGLNIEQDLPASMNPYDDMNSTKVEIKCSQDEFGCHDGSKCLLKSQQCDGITDCGDSSDEQDCEQMNCGDNFKCNDGTCISKHLVCNGLQNCPDGGDEQNCGSEVMSAEQDTEKVMNVEQGTEKVMSVEQDTEKVMEQQNSTEKVMEQQNSTEKVMELQNSTEKVMELQKSTEKVMELQNSTEKPDAGFSKEKIEEASIETVQPSPNSNTEAQESQTEPVDLTLMAAMKDDLSNTNNNLSSSNNSENSTFKLLDETSSSSSEGTVSSSTESELNGSFKHVANSTLIPYNISGDSGATNLTETMPSISHVENQEAFEGITTMESPVNSTENDMPNSMEHVPNTTLPPTNLMETDQSSSL